MIAQMAQASVKRGRQKEILLEVAYLDAIVRADSAQYLAGFSTALRKIPLDEIQEIYHLSDIALNQSSDVMLDLAMPQHVICAGVVSKFLQALQSLGNTIGIRDGRLGQFRFSGQDIPDEENVVYDVASVRTCVARQRYDLHRRSGDLYLAFRHDHINRARRGGKAGHAQFCDGIRAAEHAHRTPHGILQHHRVGQRSIDFGPGVLNQVGITPYVITVTMCIEDSYQLEALFLQDSQKTSAGAFPYACVNQECVLSIAHN